MKKIYLLLVLYTLANSLSAQPSLSQKTIIFIKVWGFLKYYHPVLAKGKVDWDKEFMNGIQKLSYLNSREAVNEFLLNRINSLGAIPACKSCKDTIAGGLNINLKLNWLNDSLLFVPELVAKLNYIRNNRNQKQNHYAYLKRVALVVPFSGPTFENEKSYPDSVFPSPQMRMLTLARYWNIVNYYYPYKYALDMDWDEVLTESVKNFSESKDTLSYHLAILVLTTRINDSHSSFSTPQIRKFFGEKRPLFGIRIVNRQPVVNYTIVADSGSNPDVIKRGDIILTVDDEPVAELIEKKMRYLQGSNEPAKFRGLTPTLLSGGTSTVKISYKRDNMVFTRIFNRYSVDEQLAMLPGRNTIKLNTSNAWKILDTNIGYINLGKLEVHEVDDAMRELMNTKGLILDLRNYPKSIINKLGNYFNIEEKAFARLTTPDLDFPGVMKHSKYLYTGRKQSAVYKGTVVVLINEQTQSMAELTAMALQTGRDIIAIGSQTAGADGDMRKIPLPGGFTATMTGLGVYYPDGKETQRIGIVPDVEVKPTITGIRTGVDEVYEYAKKIINKKQPSFPAKLSQ
ncbi:MAG: hypothetical protein EOP48_12955 [Sphingobacteriales bacterium]|nr:MAG: hypothetical protein EOP48_12955 [Sphingobacteriales bacterium]